MEPLAENEPKSFPYKGSIREQMRYLLRYAVRAQSMNDSQPWRFRLTNVGITVLADRARLPATMDPGKRGLLISLGSAIHHLTVAMRSHGLIPEIDYSISGGLDPREIATVTVTALRRPTGHDLELFAEILRGELASPKPAEVASEDVLMNLHCAMIGAGTELLFLDGRWFTSLLRDLSVGTTEARDAGTTEVGTASCGLAREEIDVATDMDRLAMPFLHFESYRSDGPVAEARTIGLPAIAMICSSGDTATDKLEAGRSLGQLTLIARRLGLRVSPRFEFWNVVGLEERLREEPESQRHPQVLVSLEPGRGGAEIVRIPVRDLIEDSGLVWPATPFQPARSRQGRNREVTMR